VAGSLRQTLSLWQVSLTGIGVILGAGVYALIGPAAARASDAPLALVAGTVLGARADAALSVLALGATANTSLLLLASASRSIYGMATAGVLPKRLARVGRTAIPVSATLLVLVLLAVLVTIGTLQQVAAMTDAAVLVSFMLVNASLPWLAAHRRTSVRGAVRAVEILLPALGFALCAWLLLHAGASSVIVALGLSGLALAAAPGTRAWGKSWRDGRAQSS